MICSDSNTFSIEQCKELLDKMLHQSKIIRPLSNADQQRLTSYYSRPVSLNELKVICSSIQSDLNEFLSLLKQRTIMNNDKALDLITQTVVNIFENRRKFSNEKCEEIKIIFAKKLFSKKRYQLINDTYQKYRVNTKNLHQSKPLISPIILNQLLTNILLQDYQVKFLKFYFYNSLFLLLGSFRIFYFIRRNFSRNKFRRGNN
jgi:hypothetical protein